MFGIYRAVKQPKKVQFKSFKLKIVVFSFSLAAGS